MPSPPQPSAAAIQDALERIVRSTPFAQSERHIRLLRFLIEETLAGRQAGIKETVIGIEVFGRAAGFDPKSDAIVRVEAGRLRTKLQQYYGTEGGADPVRIELPKGTYVPTFALRAGSPAHRSWPPGTILAAAIGLLVAVAGGWLATSRWSDPAFSVGIKDISADASDPSLAPQARAITDRLASLLAKTEGFRVTATADGASAVLTGTLERRHGLPRMTLHLVRSGNGVHLWSESYTSPPERIRDFEDMACELVARTLRNHFAGDRHRQQGRPDTTSREAQEAFLRGREDWLTQKPPGIRRSVEEYRTAIGHDTGFARAWEGIAASELFLASIFPQEQTAHIQSARQAARKAVELDERLEDPHARLGNLYLFHDLNLAEAEFELRRAVVLHPGRDAATRWYSLAARLRGHQTEALAELENAVLVNPGSPVLLTEMGAVLQAQGQLDAALAYALRALAADSDYSPARVLAAQVEAYQGKLRSAAARVQPCIGRSNYARLCLAEFGRVQALAGQRSEAEKTAADLEPDFPVLAAPIAMALGDRERAWRDLEASAKRRDDEFVWGLVHPAFQTLQGEPRFRALFRAAPPR